MYRNTSVSFLINANSNWTEEKEWGILQNADILSNMSSYNFLFFNLVGLLLVSSESIKFMSYFCYSILF